MNGSTVGRMHKYYHTILYLSVFGGIRHRLEQGNLALRYILLLGINIDDALLPRILETECTRSQEVVAAPKKMSTVVKDKEKAYKIVPKFFRNNMNRPEVWVFSVFSCCFDQISILLDGTTWKQITHV